MGPGRRQHILDPMCRGCLRGLVVFLAAIGPVRGQDCWVPAPLFPQPAGSATGSFGVLADSSWSAGWVPPFRAGERDRGTVGVDAIVRLDRVEVRAAWGWVVDTTAAGGVTTGAGDLHLGTTVTAVRAGAFAVNVGWEAKLPNAADEGEIGTDETDIRFGASGSWRGGPVSAQLGVGLAVLGNPLRFANQDDVPLVRGAVTWERAAVAVIGRAGADLPTARNPARADGDVAFRLGTRWFALVRGGGGFVPAAADWHVGLAVGYASPLPAGRPGA